jgi:hypothetical protein
VPNPDPLPQIAPVQPVITLKFGDDVSGPLMQIVKLLTKRSYLNQILILVLPLKQDGLIGIRRKPVM